MLATTTFVSAQAAKLPQTPAGKRLGEFLKAIDGDAKAKEALVQKSCTKAMRERRPMEEHLRIMNGVQTDLGGFEVTKVEKSTATEIEVQATARATGMTFYIGLVTETAAPHAIDRVVIDSQPPGSRPVQPGKVTKKQP
jgi:hypothetical protein